MKKSLMALALLLFIPGLLQAEESLLVSTCMSLRLPLSHVVPQYEQTTGVKVNINAASSGRLTLQIEKELPWN